LIGNGNLNINTRFDLDGSLQKGHPLVKPSKTNRLSYDFLHGSHTSGKIDDALVDAHLETVPGLGTLTARSLTGGDAENLGGHASRSTGLNLLLGSLLDKVTAS
jgi:hypothetical protein